MNSIGWPLNPGLLSVVAFSKPQCTSPIAPCGNAIVNNVIRLVRKCSERPGPRVTATVKSIPHTDTQRSALYLRGVTGKWNMYNTSSPPFSSDIVTARKQLCFNITEKGQMIVSDWYNRILVYTRQYGKNIVFLWKELEHFFFIYCVMNNWL